MKKIKNKKVIIGSVIVLLFVLFAIYIFVINRQSRRLEDYTEVAFVSPTQAIIFWKTEESTLGYVRYGEKKTKRDIRVNQTSSEEGNIHVVFLENIPLEGIFLTKHSEGDNFLIFPKIEYIKYDGRMDETE